MKFQTKKSKIGRVLINYICAYNMILLELLVCAIFIDENLYLLLLEFMISILFVVFSKSITQSSMAEKVKETRNLFILYLLRGLFLKIAQKKWRV